MKKNDPRQAVWTLTLFSLALIAPLTLNAQPQHPPRHGDHIMKMVKDVDADENGTITKTEIDSAQLQRFTEMDIDKDGGVNIDEFEKLWAKQRRTRMVDDFQRLDEDGDGKVVRSEFDVPLDRLMQHRDADNNGELSRDELQTRGKQKRRYKTQFQPRAKPGFDEPTSVY